MQFSVSVSERKTPYNEMPMTMVLKSIDRKVYRDIFCSECGHPFMAITDKIVTILDSNIPTDMLRDSERIVETRCKHHYCKQRYNLYL
jgi:hypothetical protein